MLGEPRYALLAALAALGAFTLATWLPNWMLARDGIFSGSLPWGEKVSLLLALWGSIGTNFTPLAAASVIAGALLFGVTLALAVFVLRRRAARRRGIGAGAVGVLAGALGLGCAACGSAVALSALLAVFGLASLVPALPFHGAEVGILGVLLHLLAIRLLARDAAAPAVCKS